MIVGTDIPLDEFRGLVTDSKAADLPPGYSPDCQDVIFPPSAVRTRPGLQSVFTALSGNPTVNYLKTFTDPQRNKRLLLLAGDGKLWQEFPEDTLTDLTIPANSISPATAGARAKSATLFGREYLAFHDGQFGLDIPRQWDGTNYDRVSQEGVGAGPTVAELTPTSSSITAISRSGNVVTVTISATIHDINGPLEGASVVIAGVTDTTFNGTHFVSEKISATQFKYEQAGANASSSGGTAKLQGIQGIAAQVSVCFVTRQGYLTRPSPPVSQRIDVGKLMRLTNIPLSLGLTNIVGRLILIAPLSSSFFYSREAVTDVSQMFIPDTTTTTWTLTFRNTALLAATPADALFDLVELGECAGVIGYALRLFWWGERNKMNNWVNLSFDGGWTGADVPLGWTKDGTSGAGLARGFSQVWGASYQAVGDGATAVRGMITQPAVKDAYSVPIINRLTAYTVRARVKRDATLAQGTLHIDLFGTGVNTTGLQVTAAQATESFQEFTAELTGQLTTVPSDLLLRVFAAGTPTSGGNFEVENIQIVPSSTPYLTSTVRASKAGDADSYDGVSGLLGVSTNDGQAVRSAFVLRDQLYLVKEHSIHMTQDDGVNEPAGWTLSEVSRTVGTHSAEGVDVGVDWAVIADREGLYLFTGGEPLKISQEIQPTWDRINWSAGHTLWVRVDTFNRRILVGVPLDAATSPNRILVLDYRGLGSSIEVLANAQRRKWAPWAVTANSAGLIERAGNVAQFFLGNDAGNGKVYRLNDAQLSDDGAAIDSYYTTAFLPGEEEERRVLLSYLRLLAEGSGTLALTAYRNQLSAPLALASRTLSATALRDLELLTNVVSERIALRFGTNAAGSWFHVQKVVPTFSSDPWSPVRGG